MRDPIPIFLIASLTSMGCGTDVEARVENLEHQLSWRQQPGEIQDCHVFKLDNSRHVEIDRLQIKFPEGSHHVHLYRYRSAEPEPTPDRVYDCFGGIDWTKWSLLMGAQTKAMDWQLPEGVTIPIEPHQQLLAQVHWLNTTDRSIESKIDLSFHVAEVSQEHLGVMFGVNRRIDIKPGQHSRVEAFCPMPEGARLHALMGHFHVHGSNYEVIERMPDRTEGLELYSAPDEPAFEFKLFLPAHDIPRGAGLQYGCGFFNPSGSTLTWGSDTQTQEHCNMTAYYSPAQELSGLCLTEPSKLSILRPQEPSVLAGRSFLFDVALVAPEASEVIVALSSDAPALEVPPSVTIPAGEPHATFTARTSQPGNFVVSASVNGASIATAVRVTGLMLSEVFYAPAADAPDELQWIEIANRAEVPLDLSGYSIGAGTEDFTTTRLALPIEIPPRGCIVVGGPQSSPANHAPTFALSADLDPDLGVGAERAAGVGLFATPERASMAPPLDAVVYGNTSTTLRGPDGQIAPVWPGSSPGGSIQRVTERVWARSSKPTPGRCEVLDAY